MSKITFRADEDLVERIEARDASKSEIMREALRAYLDESESRPDGESRRSERQTAASLDGLLEERVDELVADRLAEWEAPAVERERDRARAQDVNVNVTLDGATTGRTQSERVGRPAPTEQSAESPDDESACGQCGESLADDHVYCPNCGEKAARRVFCECGDEVRTDWRFCPGCGRRTPAADVLDGT